MRLNRHTNSVFWKAVRLLSQPVSLGAMGLLLINDHLLREFWPSWWTGKIGDFAWLLFFPFLLAALFAWLIPPRLSHQEEIVRWLAFGLTGGVFTLTKTLPGVHDVTTRCAETLLGFPVALQRDPTDLMALLSLGLGWWLWERQPASSSSCSLTGWLALPLAALLTIANMPAPDSGVDALTLKDQAVIARSSRSTFISTDGGLSWQPSEVYHSTPIHIAIEISTDLNVKYRFAPGVAIEMSKDGGTTWHEEFSLSPTGQAARVYYERRAGNPHFESGPLDAQGDPVTGNVIFAMGHEGVLVRKADAEWIWVPVGDYRRIEFGQVNVVLSLLVGEILLAVGFGLLSVVTLTLRLHTGQLRSTLVGIGWVLWGLHAAAFGPALIGYRGMGGEFIASLDHILLSAGALFVGFLVLKDMLILTQHSPEALPRLAVVGLVGIVLFFLPYVFWALDILPHYIAAVLFAFGLGAVTVRVGDRKTREFLEPVQEG